jgi:hypothetical protein
LQGVRRTDFESKAVTGTSFLACYPNFPQISIKSVRV